LRASHTFRKAETSHLARRRRIQVKMACREEVVMSEEVFSILAVCTGNVCRSPAVERLLADKLGSTVRVSSAGTHALVGHPIAEPMAALLRDSGVEPDPFGARRLSAQMLKEADLILSMTRAQRGLVVELWPAAVRRTFTLREFARLLSWVDPSVLPAGTSVDRLRAALPLAVAARGRERRSPDQDDVTDPFRLSNAVYADSFAQIRSAIDRVIYTIVIDHHSQSASYNGFVT
jgi:protein-tyrosine phosphatase